MIAGFRARGWSGFSSCNFVSLVVNGFGFPRYAGTHFSAVGILRPVSGNPPRRIKSGS
jgi:hypothetical protein